MYLHLRDEHLHYAAHLEKPSVIRLLLFSSPPKLNKSLASDNDASGIVCRERSVTYVSSWQLEG